LGLRWVESVKALPVQTQLAISSTVQKESRSLAVF
jgi:hypothetical protein